MAGNLAGKWIGPWAHSQAGPHTSIGRGDIGDAPRCLRDGCRRPLVEANAGDGDKVPWRARPPWLMACRIPLFGCFSRSLIECCASHVQLHYGPLPLIREESWSPEVGHWPATTSDRRGTFPWCAPPFDECHVWSTNGNSGSSTEMLTIERNMCEISKGARRMVRANCMSGQMCPIAMFATNCEGAWKKSIPSS
jgi:hypothetical protein